MYSLSAFRSRLYHRLFRLNTPSGRSVEYLCALVALLSVAAVFAESGAGTQYQLSFHQWHIFVLFELTFTLFFTAEYLLRVMCWPSPARYVFSFWGFIDLATLLPLYVMWLWPEIAISYLVAWRAMRAIRVLRILKLLRLMPAVNTLWQAVIAARHQLILFYAFIGILLVVAGATMYGLEGAANGFTSLGMSLYWAVVTVTTVGYGDITPHTVAGRLVASLLILIGYSVIAIPTGIIGAQLNSEMQRKKRQLYCPACDARDQPPHARFCHQCGTALQIKNTWPVSRVLY